jgi:hypothetical protein
MRLNMITLGPKKTDTIDRTITISDWIETNIVWFMSELGHVQFDYINQMITLLVITLSNFHSTYILISFLFRQRTTRKDSKIFQEILQKNKKLRD